MGATRHHRYLHTFGGQSFRDSTADPHASAGDERSFSDKLQIHDRSPESLAAKADVSGCCCASENRPEAVGQAVRPVVGKIPPAGTLSIGRPTDARRANKKRPERRWMQMSWEDEEPSDPFLPSSVTKLTLLYHKVPDLSSGLRVRAARRGLDVSHAHGVGRIRTARR